MTYFNSFDYFVSQLRANPKHVYDTCDRGDWLCWWFNKANPNDTRLFTLVKAHQANMVRGLYKDPRSLQAIDTAIAFGEGRASLEELNAAAKAADVVRCHYKAYVEKAAWAAANTNEYMAVPSLGEWGCATPELSKAADIFRKHIAFEKINIAF